MLASNSCKQKTNISYTVYGCDSIQNIDLNPYLSNPGYKLEDILDSIKIITLETDERSILANIAEIEFSQDRIFIKDLYQMGGIAIFDIKGHFIKRLKSGNGPGEIQHPINMAFDKTNEELLILDNTLKKYDKNGNNIGEVVLEYPCCKILSCNKDNYVFSNVYGCDSDIPTLSNYSVLVSDRNYNLKQLLLPYNPSSKIVTSSNTAFEYNGNIIISVPYCDTIYKFKNDSLRPYKTIDFSSEKLNIEQFVSMEDYYEKIIMTGDGSKAVYTGEFYENDSHQILELDYSSSACSIFIDKRTNNVVSGYRCIHNPKEAMHISCPNGVYNNWFYQVRDARSFRHNTITSNRYISKEDLAKLEKLTDDSNPFIVFYKLKDF